MSSKIDINKLVYNPKNILILFLIVNLIPSIGLFFSEPYSLLGKTLLLLFPLGLFLLFFSLSKDLGLIQLLLLPLLVLHAFQIVVFYLFGEGVIAVDMFLNLMTTNATEAGEVLNSIIGSVIFVLVVYIPVIILSINLTKRKKYLSHTLRRRMFFLGIILIVFSYFLSFFAKNINTERFTLYEDVYPVDVFYNLNLAINKWKKSEEYHKTSKDFKFGAIKEKEGSEREIYVLVLGETSRAENWSLYGYERKTTPHLEQDSNIIYFKDVITQSNTTHKSVPVIMSAADAENYDVIYNQKSIITAFKEVGFKTIFLSNQSANHTLTDFFAREADITQYYRHFTQEDNMLDEVMIPRFKHLVDSIPDNLFVILHTYGSHFNYKERYPANFSVYKPDNVTKIRYSEKEILRNAYDNTILYTDFILHDVIEFLTQTNSCSFLFYLSDHGEDILDDDRRRFLHASPNPTYYQLRIPMFIWTSPIYQKNCQAELNNIEYNSTKPMTTNVVFHSILDMAHVKTNYLDIDLSLASEEFKVKKRMYLNDHDKPIPFNRAGLKKQDLYMLDKRGIKY